MSNLISTIKVIEKDYLQLFRNIKPNESIEIIFTFEQIQILAFFEKCNSQLTTLENELNGIILSKNHFIFDYIINFDKKQLLWFFHKMEIDYPEFVKVHHPLFQIISHAVKELQKEPETLPTFHNINPFTQIEILLDLKQIDFLEFIAHSKFDKAFNTVFAIKYNYGGDVLDYDLEKKIYAAFDLDYLVTLFNNFFEYKKFVDNISFDRYHNYFLFVDDLVEIVNKAIQLITK